MGVRVVSAVLAILGLIGAELFLLAAFPHFMQVFKDMDVTNFPATATAAMVVANALAVRFYVTVPLTVLVAVGLVVLAVSRRVSNAAATALLVAVILILAVGTGLAIGGTFTAMIRLIQDLMNRG
jgi:hypothetical protein